MYDRVYGENEENIEATIHNFENVMKKLKQLRGELKVANNDGVTGEQFLKRYDERGRHSEVNWKVII